MAALMPAAEVDSSTGSREWVGHLHASQLGDGVEVDAPEVALVRHGRQLPPPREGQRVRHMAQRGRQHRRRQCLHSRATQLAHRMFGYAARALQALNT